MKKRKVKQTEMISMVIDDVVYHTKANKMHSLRKPYQPVNPNIIRSFMPGNIQKVFVKEGQQVKEGVELCVLEAMKMKNMILAPADGVVKRLHIKEGDIIPKDHPLVELR